MTTPNENDIKGAPNGDDHDAKFDPRPKWPFWIGIGGRFRRNAHLLEKGLPQIRFKGDLIPIRDAAQELMEPSLRHRSPTFVSGAQATIESLFKTITLEARD